MNVPAVDAVAAVTAQPSQPSPALAVTYNGDDPTLLERLIPLVDLIEVSPDAITCRHGGRIGLGPDTMAELTTLAADRPIIAHGTGLSLASHDGWEDGYLALLYELFDHFDVAWHSEHLAFCVVDGEHLGTLLPVPRTEEAVDLVCDRVRAIQRWFAKPFLLEHVISLLPDPPAEYTMAGFLNEITERTGCGVILDAYNLVCDAYNRGLDVDAFLSELELDSVVEIHLAGGVRHDGFQLDVHSQTVPDRAMDIAAAVLPNAPNLRAVTFEYLKEAVPYLGADTICDELTRIREGLLS